LRLNSHSGFDRRGQKPEGISQKEEGKRQKAEGGRRKERKILNAIILLFFSLAL